MRWLFKCYYGSQCLISWVQFFLLYFFNNNFYMKSYGTDENLGDYFLVRNSWGISYGERGYIRLNRNTTCGTDLFPL